ncbi:MAG: M56 family metallopeptidase [Planctomycetes bacterium]|nr:M56 family metallopeptidase [Planctomycetota bacterium]
MSQLPLQAALSWSLTYLLHSTLLLGAATLLVRALGRGRYGAKEWIWKTALVGGLLTSGLQVGLALDPALGRWSVLTTEPAPDSTAGVLGGGPSVDAQREGAARSGESGAGEVALLAAGGAESMHGFDLPALRRDARGQNALALHSAWRDGLLALWTLGALLGAALLGLAWSRISDRLAGRTELSSGPAVDALRELSRRAGIPRRPRLCTSPRITSPATVGVFLPQILLPERALRELSPAQQEAMLAHELAHIVRRDPQWSFFARLVERLCFLQPLNRVARKALADIAEYQSDDFAVRITGRELDLARCLTEVAGWRIEEREAVALLPMAGRGSQLSERVQRLLHPAPPRKPRRTSPLLLPASTLTLVSTAFVMPGAAAELEAFALRFDAPAPAELPAEPLAEPTAEAVAEPLSLADSLAAVLAQVDAELQALYAELALLEDRIQEQGLEQELSTKLTRLQGDAGRLRARQAHLVELLDRVLASDDARDSRQD